MAVGFVSVKHMQRRAGHSPVDRLAYIGREGLLSARTGESFDYTDRGDLLVGATTLLPQGAADPLADAPALWEAVEAASRHKFASLGLDMVVALPPPDELELDLAQELLEEFIVGTILCHGLAASYAIHAGHAGDDTQMAEDLPLEAEEADRFAMALRAGWLNRHAHVMVTPRRVGPNGLARRRCTILDPIVRNARTVDALDWGRLWAAHQNRFFATHGLSLRVRPRAAFSAPQMPLDQMRTFRKRKRRAQTDADGRALLPDQALERDNRDVLRLADAALSSRHAPFTRGEIEALFGRHIPVREEASELTGATLGLGGALALGDGLGHSSRWWTTRDAITAELAAFGRAAALARRRSGSEAAPRLDEGYSAATRALLGAVAAGPDLVVIEAHAPVDALLEDLAQLAQLLRRRPVSIAHGAGGAHPHIRVVDVDRLPRKRTFSGLVLVDRADALTAPQLDLVIQAGLAGKNRLVLIRHVDGPWPRSALLDLIAARALRLVWGEAAPVGTAAEGLRRGDLPAALALLEEDDRILWGRGSDEVDRVARQWAGWQVRGTDGSPVLLLADGDRAEALQRQMQAAALDVTVTTRLPRGATRPVLAFIDPRIAQGPMLAPQMARASDIALLVDDVLTPTMFDLADQLALDAPIDAAIVHGLAGEAVPLATRREVATLGLPRFALDFDGDPVLTAASIARFVAFWASAPFDLDWAPAFELAEGEVLAALAAAADDVGDRPRLGTGEEYEFEDTAEAEPAPGFRDDPFEREDDPSPDDEDTAQDEADPDTDWPDDEPSEDAPDRDEDPDADDGLPP